MFAGRRWTNEPDRAAYLARDDYASARRFRRAGIGLVVGGMLVDVVGYGFMMSAVCYEECDDGAGRRLTAGVAMMSIGTAAVITGAIWWIRNSRKQRRIEGAFLAHGPWHADASSFSRNRDRRLEHDVAGKFFAAVVKSNGPRIDGLKPIEALALADVGLRLHGSWWILPTWRAVRSRSHSIANYSFESIGIR